MSQITDELIADPAAQPPTWPDSEEVDWGDEVSDAAEPPDAGVDAPDGPADDEIDITTAPEGAEPEVDPQRSRGTPISADRLNATHQKALSYMGAVRPNVRLIAIEVLLAAQAAGHHVPTLWGFNPASKPEHSAGTALDFMVHADRAAGDWVAGYLWQHRARLGLRWVIWYQRIRSTSSGKGDAWRAMADRGSVTQNHKDHPHVNFWVRTYTPPPGGTVPDGGTYGGSAPPPKPKPNPQPPEPKPTKSTRYRVVTRADALNGRSGPGSRYPVTMTAAKGHILDIVETRDGWARSTGGHWYSLSYLEKVAPAPTPKPKPDPKPIITRYRVTTKSAPLNGRAGPGISHPITMTAAKGHVLDIVETRNGWARSTGGHWYSLRSLTKV